MEEQVLTFRELIAPVDPETFLADCYGKRPLHIPGPADKFARVFSWESLNELLGMSTLWTERSFELALGGRLLATEEYCYLSANREGRRVMRPDLARVRKLLRDGATLALDFIELLSPGLRSVAHTLEAVIGAPVCASAFCSWQETQGYASHFDTQNVFACHLSGTKTWRLYEGRMPNAADFPGGNRESLSREQHEQAKGRMLEEVTMTPGDLLYIPHGQYHDALSSSESCLHVSFGTMHLVALDFIQALVKDLPKDPVFREHLPDLDDPAAHRAYLRRIGERLREIIAEPAVAAQLRDFMRERAFERVADFSLPRRHEDRRFRVRWRGRTLSSQGETWRLEGGHEAIELSPQDAEVARWALARDFFALRSLGQAFGDRDLRASLERLARAGLIEPI